MARKPRPVNPEEGPVQAFAFDLRALREAAGNPTYRTLAKTAGYSATTLGDAAGGVQLPTLEVTLAYVGACDGDIAAWRNRWQEVNRAVSCARAASRSRDAGAQAGPPAPLPAAPTPTPAPPAATATTATTAAAFAPPAPAAPAAPEVETSRAEPVEQEPVEDDATEVETRGHEPRPVFPRIRGSAPWIAVTAALGGVLIASLAGAFAARQPGEADAAATTGATTTPAGQSCPAAAAVSPGAAAGPGSFAGKTYGSGANVRAGASLSSAVRFHIPDGCVVAFSGYCLGDVVWDDTGGVPDMRWFIIPGEGEVASAVVHGDPPDGLAPEPCPQDVPPPARIDLAIAPTGTGGGAVQLTAGGSRLWIVGFAAYYAAGPGSPARWHPMGMTSQESSGRFLSAPLRLSSTSGPTVGSVPDQIPVVAVACLGGGGPTDVLAAGAVRPAALQTLAALPQQSAATLAAAGRAACSYPDSSPVGGTSGGPEANG